jgi:hypothetical protein
VILDLVECQISEFQHVSKSDKKDFSLDSVVSYFRHEMTIETELHNFKGRWHKHHKKGCKNIKLTEAKLSVKNEGVS